MLRRHLAKYYVQRRICQANALHVLNPSRLDLANAAKDEIDQHAAAEEERQDKQNPSATV